ncbi:MAG: hypothetical protein OES69_15530 [Myxococcales bacterium]|nr:hypothetical protein [Myxococcales bacterium]MDH3845355.1 hypothetical protein [Myxococcales bacterium]
MSISVGVARLLGERQAIADPASWLIYENESFKPETPPTKRFASDVYQRSIALAKTTSLGGRALQRRLRA